MVGACVRLLRRACSGVWTSVCLTQVERVKTVEVEKIVTREVPVEVERIVTKEV